MRKIKNILLLIAAIPLISFADEIQIHHLHAVLRPHTNGTWFIQDDESHAPYKISKTVEQTDKFLRIFFDKNYSKVGAIQVSTDDGFGDWVSAHANVGLGNATITIYRNGYPINPSKIWSKVGHQAKRHMNGNLWINVTMIEEKSK